MEQQRIAFPDISPVQPNLRIVASCTHGKRYPVSADLMLRGIPDRPLESRLADWKGRLCQSTADPVPAIDLYRGQHWAIVRDLPSVARGSGYHADLWVASAGYGLVSTDAKIRPYSATFAASEEDSVWRPIDGDRRTSLRAWWRGLQTIPAVLGESLRSLTSLATASPEAIFLVIGSPAYISAMAEDLQGARGRLVDPQHLIVITSRDSSLPGWLESHVVPSEAPLGGIVGGALGSLHARTARRILQEAALVPLRADALVSHYSKLISELTSTAAPVRMKLDDEKVRSFIRKAITDGALSCTAALRKLRSSGQACEQRRFVSLYAEVAMEAKANAS